MRNRICSRFIAYLTLMTLSFCFAQTGAGAQNIFYTSFENVTSSNPQGWYATNGIWQLGTPPTTSGPGAAYDGAECAGTAMTTGAYPADNSSILKSPPITLLTVSSSQQINLTFWQWFDWDEGGFTGGSGLVQVSTDGGNTWATVSNPPGGNNPYYSVSAGWNLASVDLSSYAGQTIQVGFLQQGGDNPAPGWYVDDVSVDRVAIQNLPFNQGFESFTGSDGPGVNPWQGWSADNGIWQVGKPTFGPGAAYDGGAQCAGTALFSGKYSADVSSRLVSPAIAVPTLSSGKQIALTFWQWFLWDEGGFTGGSGVVQVSQYTSGVWGPWTTVSNPASNNSPYNGNSGGWSLASVDLSAYSGATIQVSFLHNGGDNPASGWYIDDVAIVSQAIPYLAVNQTNGFESFTVTDWQGWSADNGIWQVGQPAFGPGAAYDGKQSAGTALLTGAYPNDVSSRLISPPIVLPTLLSGQHANLTFAHWFDWDEGGFTGGSGQVQISTWSNGTWSAWAPIGNQYSGISGGWTNASVDLDPYTGETIEVCFQENGGDNPASGWYIDDVTITGPTTNNPVPTLTSLSLNSAATGSPATNITLTGTNFISGSVAQWNGVALTTTYVSATSLTATIPASDLTTSGTFNITVFNPTPGGGTSGSLPFKVAASGLSVTFTSPAPGAVLKAVATITGTITDTLATTGTWTLTYNGIVLGSGTGSSPSVNWNTQLFADGTHSIILSETDAKGNKASATLTIKVNNLGVSSIKILNPTANEAVKGTVKVTGAIYDLTPGSWTLTDNGVEVGSGTGGSPSISWNTTAFADGLNSLVLSEIDLAGHPASTTTNVTVNNTGVTSIKITAPAAGAVVTGTVTVTGTIADTTTGTWTLDCSGQEVASGTGTAVSASWVTTAYADGSHTLVLTETDAAGNKASATLSVTVNNKGVTSVAITSPANGTAVKGTVLVKGTISDLTPGSWTLTANGTNIGSGTGAAPSVSWNTTTISDGSYTLVLTETDTAGHTASATNKVTVNNTGVASVVITAPANNATVKGTVTVTGTITDATPGTWTLTCNGAQIGSGTGTSVSVSWNSKVFADGANKLVLTETDAAGNTGSSTVTVTVSN